MADKGGRIQNEPGGYIGGFIGDAINPGHNQRQLVANGEVLALYGDAPDSENPPRPGEIPKYVNRNCMIAQAAGSWIGGWQGASWCMAGRVAATIALGSNPIEWSVLRAGLVGGVIGGIARTNIGSWDAGAIYNSITTIQMTNNKASRESFNSRETIRIFLKQDIYEVCFEKLPRNGTACQLSKINVFLSSDGGKKWRSLRFRRNWWQQGWAIIHKGLGGSCWPPAGEDVREAFIKDEKFSISYCNLHEHGINGQSYIWLMQYEIMKDRWDLSLIEELK